jgi:hypothetical protein
MIAVWKERSSLHLRPSPNPSGSSSTTRESGGGAMESSPYALHFAFAALVSASFAAASAYYMHRKTVDHLLRFARSLDRDTRRRARLLPDGDNDHTDGEDDAPPPAHRDHDRRTMPIPPGLPPLHTGRESMPPSFCNLYSFASEIDSSSPIP